MSSQPLTPWGRPDIQTREARPWAETQLNTDWTQTVAEGRPNDMVIAISASSHTGVSGTGKTTAGIALAEEFDMTDDGFDAGARGTMNASKFAYDIMPEAPEGAALLLEEAQGTPASTGMNKRRGMKSEVIDAINGILANRDNRNTVIIVVQQLSMLDTSLVPLLDAWLLIRYEPDDPQGPLMTYHEVHGQDYQLKSEQLKTPAQEDLKWPVIPLSNDNYQAMEQKKQEAKRRDGHSQDDDEATDVFTKDDIPKDTRDELIRSTYELDGVTQDDLADEWDLTQGHINKILSEGSK